MDVLFIAGAGFGVAAFIAACLQWNRINALEAEMKALKNRTELMHGVQTGLRKRMTRLESKDEGGKE